MTQCHDDLSSSAPLGAEPASAAEWRALDRAAGVVLFVLVGLGALVVFDAVTASGDVLSVPSEAAQAAPG
ncbi:hypothetical protein M4578_21380 [Salipiger sp. P9]|uniref:hypothetical protein n=1 Tax=Salipiger pentaromativorans TaxID=2943193 RepID=UPI00215729B6|nr:hypothetical protein [Salipiger pentaromativorans]MCR8550382.1 hypothetical protein [Salipiger pentaromativorans]